MITPLPGCTPTKPGSATFPFFGVVPKILNKQGEEQIQTGQSSIKGYLVISKPWPGIMRTVYNDHKRFEETCKFIFFSFLIIIFFNLKNQKKDFTQFPGNYTTGDGCKQDVDGYYWLTGRIDDVLKVSGHLLSTAEIESALVSYSGVTEAAVVPISHDIKGEAVYAYVTLSEGVEHSPELRLKLIEHVSHVLGPICKPDFI